MRECLTAWRNQQSTHVQYVWTSLDLLTALWQPTVGGSTLLFSQIENRSYCDTCRVSTLNVQLWMFKHSIFPRNTRFIRLLVLWGNRSYSLGTSQSGVRATVTCEMVILYQHSNSQCLLRKHKHAIFRGCCALWVVSGVKGGEHVGRRWPQTMLNSPAIHLSAHIHVCSLAFIRFKMASLTLGHRPLCLQIKSAILSLLDTCLFYFMGSLLCISPYHSSPLYQSLLLPSSAEHASATIPLQVSSC